jgi:cold shock CspA family protein
LRRWSGSATSPGAGAMTFSCLFLSMASAGCCVSSSRFPEGIEALERARGIAERRNDERQLRIAVNGLAKIRTVFGKTLVAQGEVDQALLQLRCAFDLNEAAVNKRGLAIVTPILVDLLRQLGRHVEADEILCRTWVLAPDVEPKQPRVVPESNLRYPVIRLTGRVKRLLERSDGPGYGFITSDDGGPDIYVAEHQVGEQYGGLYEDAPVAVEAFTTPEGRRVARNVTIQEDLTPDVEPKQPRVVPESNLRYPVIRLTGRVKRLLERSDGPGYGFITSDDGGPDIYVAEHQVGERYGRLYEDAPVAVEAFTTPEGRRVARNVTIQEE